MNMMISYQELVRTFHSLNRLIRCVCGKKIGPDPRNFNQRVSLGRNDLLIRTFPKYIHVYLKMPTIAFNIQSSPDALFILD
ncbi:hypothetical protein ACP72F_27780 [Klebsiella pneumoniae]